MKKLLVPFMALVLVLGTVAAQIPFQGPHIIVNLNLFPGGGGAFC
jgi:hypothetical protein